MDADDVEALAALALDLDVIAVDREDPDGGEEREEIRGASLAAIPNAQAWKDGRRTKQGDPNRKPRLVDIDERSDDKNCDRGERHDPQASTQHATLVKGTFQTGGPRVARIPITIDLTPLLRTTLRPTAWFRGRQRDLILSP